MWALFRRGYYCTYHHMSPKHLHRFVNEFTVRINARSHGGPEQQMAMLVKSLEGRTLPYKQLIQ